MSEKFKQISDTQHDFQKLVGFPVDSMTARDRDEMSEKYLFKAIEEIIELRKEFPSVMNPWSRTQRRIEDLHDIKMELADVFLFLINFVNVWGISEDELWDALIEKQQHNYDHIKAKKLKILESEMKKVPGDEVMPGKGNINPTMVYVARNPEHMFSYIQDALSGLENPSHYYTSLVKQDNVEKVDEPVEKFWQEFLDRELDILKINNPDVVITHV
jgi:NTP pyrophosphatase (non-canonical NTP hydrolase)